MSTQGPREVWEIHKRQDEQKLEFLRAELRLAQSEVQRRSLEMSIQATETRIQRNTSPEVLASVEARQAEHERRQHGDPGEVAEREAAIQRARDVRESEAYRRKIDLYGMSL